MSWSLPCGQLLSLRSWNACDRGNESGSKDNEKPPPSLLPLCCVSTISLIHVAAPLFTSIATRPRSRVAVNGDREHPLSSSIDDVATGISSRFDPEEFLNCLKIIFVNIFLFLSLSSCILHPQSRVPSQDYLDRRNDRDQRAFQIRADTNPNRDSLARRKKEGGREAQQRS